jgi:hypothetical protein
MTVTTAAETTFTPFRDICRRLGLRRHSVERLLKTALIVAGGALPGPATHTVSRVNRTEDCMSINQSHRFKTAILGARWKLSSFALMSLRPGPLAGDAAARHGA